MNTKKLFTSESVTEGHPDKVCDQIADAILDDIIANDPTARVACEVCAATGLVAVFGEITTRHYADIQSIARKTIEEIGYTDPKMGFHFENCAILNTLNEQSPDIAMGVDTGGAGDQGMMFGYATDETPAFMPMPLYYSHKLAQKLAAVRKSGVLPFLRPDGKTQVTVEYDGGKAARIDAIVVSAQHDPDVSNEEISRAIIKEVIEPIVPAALLDKRTTYYINPTGRFVIGGPQGDSGLTGRKIIVDTYGGSAPHGGGAFSGKDPTKVDRSASYMARYIAKNIVAAGLATRCQIQFAYAIGVAEPVSVDVETFGTGRISDFQLTALILKNFDLRPAAIIEKLGLRRPLYRATAAYGHFGRDDLNLPWEDTGAAASLK